MKYNSLFDVLLDAQRKFAPTYHSKIYHYTSPPGLEGIVQKDNISLRFTRYDCLNDISEGYDVLDWYQRACIELLEEHVIDNDFFENINDIIPNEKKLISYDDIDERCLSTKTLRCDTYICSFSYNKDSLPMWNYYTKNYNFQGFCLGFSDFMFDELSHRRLGKGFDVEFIKVIYNSSDKLELFKTLIKNFYLFCKNDDDLKNIQAGINILLTDWQFSFKSECFSHEQEVRGIIYMPDIESNAYKIDKVRVTDIEKFYITVPFRKVYLHEIVLCPQKDKKLECNARMHIDELGYRVNFSHSKIPIRY